MCLPTEERPTSMSAWPEGFRRIPDEPWVEAPLEELALQYDTVENHGR